jgi:hypothetical protein
MIISLIELFAACCLAYAAFLVLATVVGLAGIAAANTSDALRQIWRHVRHGGGCN